MVDTKIYATSYKFCSFKLSLIICQNPSEYDKPVYDALQELDRSFLHDICHWHSFHLLSECDNYDEQEFESSWCLRQDAHNVDFPDCKGSGEINRSKRICMLRYLLFEELTVLVLGDDLHHVILNCRPVETVFEGFTYDIAP
jgi:hypothetical protein